LTPIYSQSPSDSFHFHSPETKLKKKITKSVPIYRNVTKEDPSVNTHHLEEIKEELENSPTKLAQRPSEDENVIAIPKFPSDSHEYSKKGIEPILIDVSKSDPVEVTTMRNNDRFVVSEKEVLKSLQGSEELSRKSSVQIETDQTETSTGTTSVRQEFGKNQSGSLIGRLRKSEKRERIEGTDGKSERQDSAMVLTTEEDLVRQLSREFIEDPREDKETEQQLDTQEKNQEESKEKLNKKQEAGVKRNEEMTDEDRENEKEVSNLDVTLTSQDSRTLQTSIAAEDFDLSEDMSILGKESWITEYSRKLEQGKIDLKTTTARTITSPISFSKRVKQVNSTTSSRHTSTSSATNTTKPHRQHSSTPSPLGRRTNPTTSKFDHTHTNKPKVKKTSPLQMALSRATGLVKAKSGVERGGGGEGRDKAQETALFRSVKRQIESEIRLDSARGKRGDDVLERWDDDVKKGGSSSGSASRGGSRKKSSPLDEHLRKSMQAKKSFFGKF